MCVGMYVCDCVRGDGVVGMDVCRCVSVNVCEVMLLVWICVGGCL